MKVRKSFSYIFQLPSWPMELLKMFGWILLGMFILPAIMTQGYSADVAREVMNGNETSLPKRSHERNLIDGAKLWAGAMLYMIPFFIAYFGLIMFIILAAFEAGSGSQIFVILLGLFIFVYMIAIGFILMGANSNFAAKRTFQSIFALKEIWQIIKVNLGRIIKFYLLNMLMGTFFSAVLVALFVAMIALGGGFSGDFETFANSDAMGLIFGGGMLLIYPIIFAYTAYAIFLQAHFYGSMARVAGLSDQSSYTDSMDLI